MAYAQKPDFVLLRLKCDGTRAETRFRFSTKRTGPFKSAGASVQSTTGSRGVRISGSNAGYTMFRGSVKGTGYPLHSPVSPSLPLPSGSVCHHISTGLYLLFFPPEAVVKRTRHGFTFICALAVWFHLKPHARIQLRCSQCNAVDRNCVCRLRTGSNLIVLAETVRVYRVAYTDFCHNCMTSCCNMFRPERSLLKVLGLH
jgi:hypothetical protein